MTIEPRVRRAALGPILSPLIAWSMACSPADTRTYLERLGNDTTAIEVFTRTADRIEGDVVTRSPFTLVGHYVGDVSEDGRLSRLEVEWRVPPENPDGRAPEHFVISFDGNEAVVERQMGDDSSRSQVTVPEETVPRVGRSPMSYGILETMIQRVRARGVDSLPVHLLQARRPQPSANAVWRHGTDTYAFSYFGNPMLARVDADGRLLSLSGSQTTNRVEGALVDAVDFDALVSEFAARDARGEGLGVPSPRADVEATVGDARLSVEYSRPAKRGREIFGGLVAYDAVWRTGANSATHFSTDRDVVMRGTRIPAGTYTLWSTFTADAAELIVNRQTQQWGTQYDMGQDLARIPMDRETSEESLERFTISIEERAGGGVLVLAWDRSRYSVPFVVR